MNPVPRLAHRLPICLGRRTWRSPVSHWHGCGSLRPSRKQAPPLRLAFEPASTDLLRLPQHARLPSGNARRAQQRIWTQYSPSLGGYHRIVRPRPPGGMAALGYSDAVWLSQHAADCLAAVPERLAVLLYLQCNPVNTVGLHPFLAVAVASPRSAPLPVLATCYRGCRLSDTRGRKPADRAFPVSFRGGVPVHLVLCTPGSACLGLPGFARALTIGPPPSG